MMRYSHWSCGVFLFLGRCKNLFFLFDSRVEGGCFFDFMGQRINKYIFFSLFAFLTAFSSALYGQWTEHRTPVGKYISSLAFVGDQVFAQLTFPNSIAFETVTAQNGGPCDMPRSAVRRQRGG